MPFGAPRVGLMDEIRFVIRISVHPGNVFLLERILQVFFGWLVRPCSSGGGPGARWIKLLGEKNRCSRPNKHLMLKKRN